MGEKWMKWQGSYRLPNGLAGTVMVVTRRSPRELEFAPVAARIVPWEKVTEYRVEPLREGWAVFDNLEACQPVPSDTRVDVKTETGAIFRGALARDVGWAKVVAYRLVDAAPEADLIAARASLAAMTVERDTFKGRLETAEMIAEEACGREVDLRQELAAVRNWGVAMSQEMLTVGIKHTTLQTRLNIAALRGHIASDFETRLAEWSK